MDVGIKQLVDRGVAGNLASRAEVKDLLVNVKCGSRQAAYIHWGARIISERASHGYGQVFAQIGIDSTPCPADCIYCMYAKSNSTINTPEKLSVDEIVRYAKLYDSLGIHLLSIMCTSSYPFGEYCDVIKAIRSAVSDDLPIMANLGDIDDEKALHLKHLGVQACYHVVRINEGKITHIAPDRRLKTIAAWQKASVKLTSCVEPVYEEAGIEAILDAMERIRDMQPIESRVMSLYPVAGSPMEHMHGLSLRKRTLVNDIYRLLVGDTIAFGGSDNTVWVNAGIDPKGRIFSKDAGSLSMEVKLQKKLMAGAEWKLSQRPLSVWFE